MVTPQGQCTASYSVTFTVGNVPGDAVTITYVWHLANGSASKPNTFTLKSNSSQSFGLRETSSGITSSVYVTWTADGDSGTSNKAQVIFCPK